MHNLNRPTDAKPKHEAGVSLVMAVFVLALLTGIGLALLFLSQGEIKMGKAGLRPKQAFYLAEAGVEAARLNLFNNIKNTPFEPALATAAGGNGVPDIDPDAIRPVYDSAGRVTGFTGYGDDEPLALMTQFGDGWYIGFLTNDPDDPDPLNDTNDRVMLTAVGAGPDRSVEVVQAIIERDPIFPSRPPAAITLLGPTPYFDGGESYAKEIVGNDCDSAGIPGLFVPTVGVVDPDALVDPCPVSEPSTESIYCGVSKDTTYETGPYTGEDTLADVTDPDVIGTLGPIDPDWTDCQVLLEMVESVRGVADVICPSGRLDECPNLPPSDPTRVIFVDGDIFIDPEIGGAGTVLATGELWLHGDTAWTGMLLAIGEGIFWRYGGGTETVSGAIFVADIAGPDEIFGTEDDCTGGEDGFMPAYFDMQGGGAGDVVYCTIDGYEDGPQDPYKIVDFLQR